MKELIINKRKIGIDSSIFLIAEAGVNHNGDLETAKKLIDLAAKAEVDAIKFQTFITKNLLLETTPKAEYQKYNTNIRENFYEMVKKYELTKEDFIILKRHCDKKGIIFLSTPFDKVSVNWLEELDVSVYKIGSGDMNNFPLLKFISTKKKPILLSTGMSTLEEVKESVEFLKENDISDLIILQCTTNYPTPLEEINLNVIETYKHTFPDDLIGFSDHSLGIEASIAAAAKGVVVIEKHFTLDKEMEGPDHNASLNPDELIEWVKAIRKIEKALGLYEKIPTNSEIEIAKVTRKSIVTIRDLQKGCILDVNDIGIKRPGTGIQPKDFEKVIGYRINKDISKDTILKWEDLE